MSFRKCPVLLNSIFQRIADIPIFIIFLIVICKFRSGCYCTCYHVYRPIIISIVNHHYNNNELMNKFKKEDRRTGIFSSQKLLLLSIKMIHTLNNQGLLLFFDCYYIK